MLASCRMGIPMSFVSPFIEKIPLLLLKLECRGRVRPRLKGGARNFVRSEFSIYIDVDKGDDELMRF